MKQPYSYTKLTCLLATACFVFAPGAFAVDPPPDGGYANANTAEGENALFSLTSGFDNTAIGHEALFSVTAAGENTAVGFGALRVNTSSQNTAVGDHALYSNTTGGGNIALGYYSLFGNISGDTNVALGYAALENNTSGNSNVGIGWETLQLCTTGFGNVAVGPLAALGLNGSDNVAIGDRAMANTIKGDFNTAAGYSALSYATGSHNIGLGAVAGVRLTYGSYNIEIGNHGMADDQNTIRIGNGLHRRTFIAGVSGVTVADGVPVVVNADGQIGVITSTAGLKEAVRPMAAASAALYALQPVTFHYKKELDPKATPQFGLVAEEVAKVDPDLVARDSEGKPYTVRYEAVNAMLLNEFLKEHRKVEALEETVAKMQATIDKVSARLEAKEAAGTLAENR